MTRSDRLEGVCNMGKVKKLAVLGIVGAAVAAIAKRLQGGGTSSQWQSSEPKS